MKSDQDFQYLQEDIAEAKARRKKNQVSLNEAERRKELASDEARLKSRGPGKNVRSEDGAEQAADNGAALRDDGLQQSERNMINQLAAEKAKKDAKDILLDEAVNILGDEIAVRKTGNGLTARVQRAPVVRIE